MLNISNHYVGDAIRSRNEVSARLKQIQEELNESNRQVRFAMENATIAKNSAELKKVSKQFKAMVAFPTPHGVYVQLGNVLREDADNIRQFLEAEMKFKPEVMGGGSVIYYSPVGHQYFVRYL